jgi:hypothetical protein
MSKIRISTEFALIILIASVVFVAPSAADSHSGYCKDTSGEDLSSFCESQEDLRAEFNQFFRNSESYTRSTADKEPALEQLKDIQKQMKTSSNSKGGAAVELFNKARDGDQPTSYLNAKKISNLELLSENQNNQINNYNQAIRQQYNKIRSSLITTLAIGVGGGILIGIIGGSALPVIKYRRIKEKASITRDVNLGRRQVLIPAVLGALMLAAGIGIYSLVIGWETIITVIA